MLKNKLGGLLILFGAANLGAMESWIEVVTRKKVSGGEKKSEVASASGVSGAHRSRLDFTQHQGANCTYCTYSLKHLNRDQRRKHLKACHRQYDWGVSSVSESD